MYSLQQGSYRDPDQFNSPIPTSSLCGGEGEARAENFNMLALQVTAAEC